MRSYSHLFEGTKEHQKIGVLAGCGAVDGAYCLGRIGRAKATISRELQRNALPLGGYSPLTPPEPINWRRRREAILEREAALRLFVGDRLAEDGRPNRSPVG